MIKVDDEYKELNTVQTSTEVRHFNLLFSFFFAPLMYSWNLNRKLPSRNQLLRKQVYSENVKWL